MNTDLSYKPIGYSYRVADNIWAGEYPVWDWEKYTRIRQLKIMTDFGITDFLDLTEYGEMPPYEEFLDSGRRRHVFPIRNGFCPGSVEEVASMFRELEEKLSDRQDYKLYIHCHGGVGRTGTIVACWYIWSENLTFEEALAKMRERFKHHRRSDWMKAPETSAQVDFIREFADFVTNVRNSSTLR